MKSIAAALVSALCLTAGAAAPRAPIGTALRAPIGTARGAQGSTALRTPLSAAQRTAGAAAALPPLVHSCPHHPDVVEDKPGQCPICRMTLTPVRLAAAWMCPVHAAVSSAQAGTCRICQRRLMPVTVAVTWTCRSGSDQHLEPGTCSDGSPRTLTRNLRPHGNHNPQHGGQFFMAPDNWHHVEGAYPRERVFRLHVYDDYGRPLPAASLRKIQARVMVRETFDPKTKRSTEQGAVSLRPAGEGYLEARIDAATLPRDLVAKVRFPDQRDEHRFDFTFTGLTREPEGVAPTATTRANTASSPTPKQVSGSLTENPPPVVSASDPVKDTEVIPTDMAAIVARLKVRSAEVGTLIQQGNFAAVWVAAFAARDLALALEPHLSHLPASQRDAADPALREVVRTAWLLDAYGDVGNRQELETVYASFARATSEVIAAFGDPR